MGRLVIFLVFLIASVWTGIRVIHHPGYLLFAYYPWLVQMPIWFGLLSLFILFGLFYLLINSIDHIHFLLFRLQSWLRFRRERRSHSKTQQGLAAIIEGRWKKAEKLLLAGMNQTGEPLINYLGAAKAAHELQAYDRRDQYIQQAYHVAPDATLAIGVTQAELEFSQGHYMQAAATLNHLREEAPRHPRILKLLEKIYIHSADWESLQALLPSLRKAKVLSVDQYELFEKNIYCELLNAAGHRSLANVQQLWRSIPKQQQQHPDVVCSYIKQLIQTQGGNLAAAEAKETEELIRKTLKHHYHGELVKIYSTLAFNNLNRQLVIAGAWLKTYGQQPELLLFLGKLCTQIQLWGKAKDYFEKCLAMGNYPEAALQYGLLLESLGETEQAVAIYKEGLRGV